MYVEYVASGMWHVASVMCASINKITRTDTHMHIHINVCVAQWIRVSEMIASNGTAQLQQQQKQQHNFIFS